MTYLFLDTNIFLHYTFYADIPWEKIIGDDFKLIIAPAVLSELDKHKRHPNAKIATRAKKILIRIEEIQASPESYPLACVLKRPKQETIDRNHLDQKEQDDVILASILDFIEEHEHTDAVVKFITNDTGPRLRSGSLGITALKLPEEYLLTVEKSEERKQIEKLTKENISLKGRIPKLALCFNDKSIFLRRKMEEYREDLDLYVETRFKQMNNTLKPLVYEDPNKKKEKPTKMNTNVSRMSIMEALDNVPSLVNSFNSLSLEQVNEYNEALEEYRKDYRAYLHEKCNYERLIKHSFPLEISLFNTGNTPAEDIDIWIHFPDGFELMNFKDFPNEPKPPRLPYRYKHRYDMGESKSIFGSTVAHINKPTSIPQIYPNEPSIRKTNSYEVKLHYRSLKHFQSHDLDTMIVTFASFDEIISFSIDYRLMVSNIPETVTGKLTVHLDKNSS